MGTTELDILDNYDVIQLSLTGLSGVVRKVNISSQKLKDILRNSGCVHFGNSVSNARSALIYDGKSCSGAANVDLSTLRELPWLSSQNGQRVGGALCQIASPAHQPSVVCSPRAAALKQVKRLKEDFGLIVMSAFEAEFMIFEKDGITPFNNVLIEPYGRADNMSGREAILLGTCSMMDKAGLPLESFMTEFAAAQFELTFRPEEGVSSADTITIMKDALRSCLSQNDMAVTFMACPLEEGHANGFHFNHSLWTSDGQNALLDSDDPLFMSDTARHWIAGLIHHAPALTALLCPTINCYRRLADEMCPKLATWGVENRRSYLRIKTDKKNVYIENRLPSSASNTYLDVAAILAAGLDGLERKLPCPAQSDTSSPLIPRKPEESLSALEEDDILRQAIGEDLVKGFIEMTKRGLSARVDGSDTLAFQRDVYFHAV
ncbi:lengsin [Biomphalaria glabrata]|nr:lengsin-like [Biomphalaria glabrata]